MEEKTLTMIEWIATSIAIIGYISFFLMNLSIWMTYFYIYLTPIYVALFVWITLKNKHYGLMTFFIINLIFYISEIIRLKWN